MRGGVVMVALLGMTLSVTSQAAIQRERAQQIRAVDEHARDHSQHRSRSTPPGASHSRRGRMTARAPPGSTTRRTSSWSTTDWAMP